MEAVAKILFAIIFMVLGVVACKTGKVKTEAGELEGSSARFSGVLSFLLGSLYLTSQILKLFGVTFLDDFIRGIGIMQSGN